MLVEQASDVTRADLTALYLTDDRVAFRIAYRRGRLEAPALLDAEDGLVSFLLESDRSVVLLERRPSPFLSVLLDGRASSGMALPLVTKRGILGLLILNSIEPNHFGRSRLQFLESLVSIASGMLNNARLYEELKAHAHRIEELQRYQERVFSSMTNLLVTTDEARRIRYFNRAASDRLDLTEAHLGRPLDEVLGAGLSRTALEAIDTAAGHAADVLGLQGIYRTGERNIDYSLNISPLSGRRGRGEGLTLLFTDQTAEAHLRKRMRVATEQRRAIKDMFSAYLSEEIVEMLVDNPELVRPGGGSRIATVFFADIAGYTSFSEGRDPEFVVSVLNEFFEEAEPVVRRYRGYLDKYIGDCIMAVFGVPVMSGEDDTIRAVRCAVELQELVNGPSRSFFRGEAEHLRIQIGMHTGPVVAGNLGGSRRMDFTEIGDTVNVAARLEGVAGPGEIIITEQTRLHLGDRFRIEPRRPVRVKGKANPIPIYNVTGVLEDSA